MELPGKRKRGRPKRRFMDALREDMTLVEVTEEDTEVGPNGDGKSAAATLDGRSRKKKRYIIDKLHVLVLLTSQVLL